MTEGTIEGNGFKTPSWIITSLLVRAACGTLAQDFQGFWRLLAVSGGLEEDDDDFVEDDQAATVPANQKLDFASKCKSLKTQLAASAAGQKQATKELILTLNCPSGQICPFKLNVCCGRSLSCF